MGQGGRVPGRIELAAEFLQPVPSGQTRVIDLGCGDGALGEVLQWRGDYDLIGVDVSPVALTLAGRGYSRSVRCDIDEEPEKVAALDLESIHYVVALEVLEHLRYPEVLLRLLASSCGPDTRYVFSFPNIAWYGYRRQLLRGKLPKEWFYGTSEHLHWFTLDSFRDMLGSCGFGITAVTAKYFCPWVIELLPARLLRWIQRRYLTLFGNQIVVACAPSPTGAPAPDGDNVFAGGVQHGSGAPEYGDAVVRASGAPGRVGLPGLRQEEQSMGFIRKAVTRCRQRIAHLPVMAARLCSGYYRLPSQRRLLAKPDWNVLIVLDACRADAFRQVINPDAGVVRSLAPCTRAWIRQFGRITARQPERPDVLWVTANPVVDRDCARYGLDAVRLMSVWRTRWGHHGEAGIPTVHPDAVNDEVRQYLRQHGQPERMIIHYMQPHAPYIGSPELASARIGPAHNPLLREMKCLPDPEDAVRRGDLTWQEVREAYDGNLKLVWDSVQRLLPDLKGHVIVTADHGELLGEGGRFGHGCRCTTELLRRVPWVTYDGGPYEPSPVHVAEEEAQDGDLMERKLRALGYV